MIVQREDHLEGLDFGKGEGLLPLVAQHALTGEILMLGYANRDAVSRTLKDQVVWFYSRSRRRLWRKGETSGNSLLLTSLHADCDGDALVALVLPEGPSCHTGERTCFAAPPTLPALATVIESRAREREARDRRDSDQAPSDSYTVRLLDNTNLRLKKLAEESLELALACASRDRPSIAREAADLVYHVMVACQSTDVSLEDILAVLAERRAETGASGV